MTHQTGTFGQFLDEHVCYEYAMLNYSFQKLKTHTLPAEQNILIEAFCIHARNLIDFYRNKKLGQGSSDAIASDFTSMPYTALFVLDYHSKSTTNKGTIYQKLNKQIQHLSYERISANKIDDSDRKRLFDDIENEHANFMTQIDAKKLVQNANSALANAIFVVGKATNPSATNAIGTIGGPTTTSIFDSNCVSLGSSLSSAICSTTGPSGLKS